jgi:hypothetical protein
MYAKAFVLILYAPFMFNSIPTMILEVWDRKGEC